MTREERELYNAVINAILHCNDGPCKDCPCYDERACQLPSMSLDLIYKLAEKLEDAEKALDTD